MLNVMIIGATSAIAEATARRYALAGAQLFLVGRNESRLADIAADLKVRGASGVAQAVLEINDIDNHDGVLDTAWSNLDKMDVVLIAHGTLPDQAACEKSVPTILAEFNTNGTSTLALMTALAQRLEHQGHGTLAVISSVAGDRGRQGNYAYGAAKAAVSAFASGLGQRLAKKGIHVLTIKPGFVDTPMTKDFRKGALWASPDQIARGIVWAVKRRKGIVYLPWFWWPIMFVIRHIPEFVFRRLSL